MAEVHRILKEMYIGMAVCMIVFLAIGAFFMRPYYIFALALLVGNLGGALRIYHIYDVLDQALDMGEAGAKKKVIVNSLLLGMIEPKICAYLQPQMRKWLIRLGLEEPEEEHKDKK